MKYESIDQALLDISEASPKNHEEVFRFLANRDVTISDGKLFKAGWLKGFEQNEHDARAWLSRHWGRFGLPPFPRGPKDSY